MSASDLLNEPVELMLGTQKIRVKRLSKLRLYQLAEDHVLQREMHLVAEQASHLVKEDRMAFVLAAQSQFPRGLELTLKARELIVSDTPRDLLIAWVRSALAEPLSQEAIYDLTEEAGGDQLTALLTHILSLDKKKQLEPATSPTT
jgi:hypothetical protein